MAKTIQLVHKAKAKFSHWWSMATHWVLPVGGGFSARSQEA